MSFLFFSKLWFFRLLGGSKGKKWPKMRKKLCLLCLKSQELYIIWSSFMVHMSNRIISPGLFLHLFQIFIFGVKSGVKGQKMAQSDKKLCLSYFISQEACIIWLLFLLYMCKMMTSPDAFIIFLKFVCLTPYLRNCTSCDCRFWYTCVKWWYLQQSFSFFLNSDFLGF